MINVNFTVNTNDYTLVVVFVQKPAASVSTTCIPTHTGKKKTVTLPIYTIYIFILAMYTAPSDSIVNISTVKYLKTARGTSLVLLYLLCVKSHPHTPNKEKD